MATYSITTAVPNGNSLFDIFTRTGSGASLSTFSITNTDGTVTTFNGSNLTWNGTTATAGTVTSIVRKSADGTITYDQITGFTGGVNDSFTSIWNPAGQAVRAGFIFSGADSFTGDTGNDFFRGYNGADTFNGGTGNDSVGYENDGLLAGGTGAIIVNMSSSTQLGVAANSARDGFGSIDSLTSIEEARGGAGADNFFGSATYNFFSGRQGADTYDGGNTVAFFKPGGNLPGTSWNWVDYRTENTLAGSTSGISITLTNGTATPGIDGVGNTAGSGTDTFGALETFTNINAIRGSMGTGVVDTVNGNGFANYFEGLAGADTFDGNGGIDRYGYNNEFRFGGSTTRGVIVNLSDNAVTVGAVSVAAHTGIDTFNGATGFVDSLIDVEDITGTNQADTIYGNQFDNGFYLFSGNDEVFLGRGFDYVEPGAGNDIIHGEAGAGFDQSYEDRDEVSYDDFGSSGIGVYIDLNLNTFVDPTGGIDTVFDIERLRGTSSADTLIGSDAANQREEMYRGLGGNDVIDGRNGYDLVDYSIDAFYGGAGGIIANLSTSAITVGAFTVQGGTVRDGFGATDTIFYIEGVRGTNSNDTMVGNAGNNQFRPMGGNDTINGGDGLDGVEMYIGDVFSGLGAIVNLHTNPFVFGGHTVDPNTARGVDGGLSTLTSIEIVTGSASDDGINGSDDRDSIQGWFGNDVIFGNGGNDVINGLQGANNMDGGDGFDTVSFMYDQTIDDYFALNYPGNGFGLWGGVTVNLGTQSATGFDGLANVLTNFEAVTGTFVNDNITGDGLDNSFRGLSGDDTIDGAGGNDTVNYSPTNQDGRVLVPIVGVNYSEPNVVRVNLTTGALTLGGILVAAGTALDGEGGTDTLTSIENVIGSIGDDFIAASLVANVIDGWTGNDTVVYAGVQSDYTITTVNGGWQVVRNAAPADVDILRNVETLAFTGGGTTSLTAQGLTETGPAQDNEITGVNGADNLDGGAGADFIDGGEGSDNIIGGTGSDELVGDNGDDVVDGGADNDTIVGGHGQGNDTYIGGTGIDTVVYTSTTVGIIVDLDVPGNPGTGVGTATGTEIDTDQLTGIENVVGGQGPDSITGDSLDNNLSGVAGADQLFGEGGNDTLQGGSGNDALQGAAGNDLLYGDSDDDSLKGGAGDDLLDGGANSLVGGDTADFSDATGAVVATLGADGDAVVTAPGIGTDTLIRIENLTGGSFGDTLTGNALNNVFFAGAGSDTLNGGDGDDTLVGNDDIFASEADTFDGGNGSDTLYAEATDIIQGGADRDFVYVVNSNPININLGATSIEWIQSDFGNDIIDGSTQTVGIEVYSDGGNDTITGSAFDDIIWSGSGNDTVTGGDGADVIVGDIGADSISGGNGNDSLYVDSSDTLIDGGAGFDAAYITSGAGLTINLAATQVEFVADFVPGGGNDAIDGSGTSVNLEVYAAGGTDTVTGGTGADFLWGGSGGDTVTGNGGNDTLVGETGADRLTGGAGTDALYGTSGNGGDSAIDTFVFGDGWGTDFVFDFEHDIDKLDVSDVTGLNNFADFTVTNTPDGHCYLAFGGNLIAVANHTTANLTASDFIF